MSSDAGPKDGVDNTKVIHNSMAKTEGAPATLPEIPKSGLDIDLSSFIEPTVEDRVKKRASNILKLTEENEKLKAELKAVTDRLERRREELARGEQKVEERPQ
ncbi:hypothetical protein AX15_003902 [Amanita polypyramis BW_CC]|nr:hypothetical protein AX15_003902 [Amanita polypyramis BW_CC]